MNPRWLIVASILMAAAGAPPLSAQTAAAEWWVAAADVRFELEITRPPSEPCAGVIAFLPDSGLLPRPFPGVIVGDAAGRELRSEVLWWNQQEGLGIVFAAPAEGNRVWVYVRSANHLALHTPQSPFCPSLLLYTQPGAASLGAAKQLARETPPGRAGRMGQIDRIGERRNPFGADDNFISSFTGWLKPPTPGTAWLAVIADDAAELWVDGRQVAAWPAGQPRRAGAKGEFGGPVALTGDRHRIEYYHFETTGGQEMHLVWRPPGAAADALPVTVPASAFVRSGATRVTAAEARTGAPLAIIEAAPASYLWTGQQPVNLFRLTAGFADKHPAGTTYTWDLGDRRQLTGASVPWLVEGDAPRNVTLTVAAGRAVSRATRPIYFDVPPAGASANSAQQRRRYREALLARCQATPGGHRPCADWSADLWATLFAVLEPYEGWELLREMFARSRADILALKPEQRIEWEDYFWSAARAAVAAETPPVTTTRALVLAALEQLQREERDNARRLEWMLRRVELLLHELEDPARARAVAQPLRELATAGGRDSLVRWLVRRGDIERLTGHLDQARRFYTEAADRRQAGTTDWRAAAVRQASNYEMTRSLIEQKAYFEAQAVLRAWELEFPLSKLDGDYPLVEAAYWKAIGQCAQAVRITRAYRAAVGLSNFLPGAMELELDCLVTLNRGAELRELSEDINKRFPNLPLARRAQQLAEAAKP